MAPSHRHAGATWPTPPAEPPQSVLPRVIHGSSGTAAILLEVPNLPWSTGWRPGGPGHRVAGIATTGPSVAAGNATSAASAASAASAGSAAGTDRLRRRKLQRQRTYRTVNDCFNVALELSPM